MKDQNSISGSGLFTGPDVCTYNSLIHVLCLVGKVQDALHVYGELRGSGHEPDPFTYRILIHGCSKSYRVEDATRIFNEMQYNGFQPDTIVYNSLLDGFMKARKLIEACQLFEKMMQDGIRASCWTYNILIDGLIKMEELEGQFRESLQLVEEMEARGFVVDLVTITGLFIELYKRGQWGSVERLMKHIRDVNLLPNVLKWKANMEATMRSPPSARKDFTSMFPFDGDFSEFMESMGFMDLQSGSSTGSDCDEKTNVDMQSSDTDECLSSPHMDRLANQIRSDNHVFPWFSLSKGKRVLAKGMSSFDIDMVNTYLSIFLAKGKLSLACKLFEIFTNSGVCAVNYTYNSIVSSFVKKGYFNEAWGALQDMGEKLCPADIATYNIIIQSLGKMGRADLASSILDKLMEEGGYLDVIMYNTLINVLGKAGRVDKAYKLFEQMKNSGVNPDIVTFNTLIEVHTKVGRLKDAYKFLRMMLDAGCSPNHVTDTTLDYLGKEIENMRYQKATINVSSMPVVTVEPELKEGLHSHSPAPQCMTAGPCPLS
ncbi:hypothetical protein Nepgr_015743 [Nepenthes gracilis]|uniref:Pentatricopeptide repeat-containing protein n=1 Tax=Nepenthes gracilis TaxID=150966 RepID=A0AAD3XQM9_NEPGR|nr:hypothetical protein Nepgr_015743 [Nepenthes gracilis]